MGKSIKDRITQAIDVSAALDNCFFNAFALNLIVNNLEFPADFFQIYPHDSQSIRDLKNYFTKKDDLLIFDTFGQLKYPEIKTSWLFEKTMVSGILFRSWFVNQLLADDRNRDLLFAIPEGNCTPFKMLVDVFNSNGEFAENILGDVVAYQANRDFFQNRCEIKPTDDESLIKRYWQENGYRNYCHSLGVPGMKITPDDVGPVLIANRIACVIYDKTGAKDNVVLQRNIVDDVPVMELALDVLAGHYFLIQTEQGKAGLQQYVNEHLNYKKEREIVLAADSFNKLALCKSDLPLMLAVTLPNDQLQGVSPLELLLTKIAHITDYVNEISKVVAPVISTLPSQASSVNTVKPKKNNKKHQVAKPDIFLQDSNIDLSHGDNNNQPKANPRSAPLNQQERIYAQHLKQLGEKARVFHAEANKEKYGPAAKEATELYNLLNQSFLAYLDSPKTRIEYRLFKKNSFDAIRASNNRGILQQHRGVKEILGNIALAVLGLGVFYLIAGAIKYACTGEFLLFKPITDTENTVRETREHFPGFTVH